MSIKQYKPEADLHEQIKKYAQARIPHHRDVMPVWDMIGPTMEKVSKLEESDRKPCKEDLRNMVAANSRQGLQDLPLTEFSKNMSDRLTDK